MSDSLKPFRVAVCAVTVLALLPLTAGLAEEEPKTLEVGGLAFTFTDSWTVKPQPRAMSQGGITRPSKADEDAIVEADFYHFGRGQGGGVHANVQRWLGQFEGEVDAATHKMEIGGLEITLVKASGTYLDGPPLGEKVARPNYALLGAIIDRPTEGSVFIKMTGPIDDLKDIEEEFKALVTSPFDE